MPTTYDAIATQTLSSSTATVTFSSIPSTFTDLMLVVAGSASTSQNNLWLRFNGDTGANYSATIIFGDGASAGSVRQTSINGANVGGLDTTTQSNSIIHIMNYNSSAFFKTAIGRSNSSSSIVAAKIALWRNTSAITSVVVLLNNSDTFVTGTTFTLYGIKAA